MESTSNTQRKKIWHSIHKCTENCLIYSHNGETNHFKAWTFKVKSDTHSYIHLLCLSIREHRITLTVHNNLRSLQDQVAKRDEQEWGTSPSSGVSWYSSIASNGVMVIYTSWGYGPWNVQLNFELMSPVSQSLTLHFLLVVSATLKKKDWYHSL